MATHSSILPGESHGQKSLAAYAPWVTKSQTWLKQLSMHAQHLGKFQCYHISFYFAIYCDTLYSLFYTIWNLVQAFLCLTINSMCFLCILNFFLKFNIFISVILEYISIDINDRDLSDINIATSNYFLHCIFLLCFGLLCVDFVLVLSI